MRADETPSGGVISRQTGWRRSGLQGGGAVLVLLAALTAGVVVGSCGDDSSEADLVSEIPGPTLEWRVGVADAFVLVDVAEIRNAGTTTVPGLGFEGWAYEVDIEAATATAYTNNEAPPIAGQVTLYRGAGEDAPPILEDVIGDSTAVILLIDISDPPRGSLFRAIGLNGNGEIDGGDFPEAETDALQSAVAQESLALVEGLAAYSRAVRTVRFEERELSDADPAGIRILQAVRGDTPPANGETTPSDATSGWYLQPPEARNLEPGLAPAEALSGRVPLKILIRIHGGDPESFEGHEIVLMDDGGVLYAFDVSANSHDVVIWVSDEPVQLSHLWHGQETAPGLLVSAWSPRDSLYAGELVIDLSAASPSIAIGRAFDSTDAFESALRDAIEARSDYG